MNLGRDWRTFCLTPLLAEGSCRGRPPPVARRSQAHRATAMSPTTQIKAQRSTARMTTKSDSTLAGSREGGAAVWEELVVVVRGGVMVSSRVSSERERDSMWSYAAKKIRRRGEKE